MKKVLAFVILAIGILSASVSDAQVPPSSLTIRLTGSGAVMGRLSEMSYFAPGAAGPQLIDCPLFRYQEGVSQYEPLAEAQTVCTSQLPTGSWVTLGAPLTNITSADGWIVSFKSFGGCVSPHPDICDLDLSGNAEVTAEFAASATPAPTPTPTATATATPDPKVVADEYVQDSSALIGKKLAKISIRKLAGTKKLKLKLGKAPSTGKLNIRLTANIKKKTKNAAMMGAFINTLVLAKITKSVQQGAPVNANLKFTSKGRNYFSNRTTVKATLDVRFTRFGRRDVSSVMKKVTFRKR